MKTTLYSVWTAGEGDIFKGYENKFISCHLSSKTAQRVASLNNGYVEEEEDNCHEDFIAQLKEQDKTLDENYRRISSSAKNMLAYGG